MYDLLYNFIGQDCSRSGVSNLPSIVWSSVSVNKVLLESIPFTYTKSMTAFLLQRQSWVVVTEIVWSISLKYLPSGPLRKCLLTPFLEQWFLAFIMIQQAHTWNKSFTKHFKNPYYNMFIFSGHIAYFVKINCW